MRLASHGVASGREECPARQAVQLAGLRTIALLEFPLWYLRQRGWIEVLDSGKLAVTVDRIDRLGSRELALPADRLLGPSTVFGEAGATSAAPGARTLDDHPAAGQAAGTRVT